MIPKGFTLVELIVVIGIIGVLASVLIVNFSGGTESARAAKCLTNMRNLAQITIGTAARMSNRWFPPAGSRAILMAEQSTGDICYKEEVGWISWLCKNDEYGMHKKGDHTHPRGFVALDNASAYSKGGDNGDAVFAITNGAVWKSANGNREVYVCPAHALAAQKKGVNVNWSYVMNAYFGYDWSNGSKAVAAENVDQSSERVSMNSSRLDRTLLFAELPFNDHEFGGSPIDTDFEISPSTENDCVLQYKANYDGETFNKSWNGKTETIAFNHKSGKRWCAHVVFADGHAERLLLPKTAGGGLTKEQLTALLCGSDKRGGGKDITFDGNVYGRLKD